MDEIQRASRRREQVTVMPTWHRYAGTPERLRDAARTLFLTGEYDDLVDLERVDRWAATEERYRDDLTRALSAPDDSDDQATAIRDHVRIIEVAYFAHTTSRAGTEFAREALRLERDHRFTPRREPDGSLILSVGNQATTSAHIHSAGSAAIVNLWHQHQHTSIALHESGVPVPLDDRLADVWPLPGALPALASAARAWSAVCDEIRSQRYQTDQHFDRLGSPPLPHRWLPYETPWRIGELFEIEPPQYGMRGDPHLWHALRRRFAEDRLPDSPLATRDLIARAFEELVGVPARAGTEHIYCEEFDLGSGTHAGWISPDWWARTLIPLLHDRHQHVVERRTRR